MVVIQVRGKQLLLYYVNDVSLSIEDDHFKSAFESDSEFSLWYRVELVLLVYRPKIFTFLISLSNGHDGIGL